jgi:hypothetical protein
VVALQKKENKALANQMLLKVLQHIEGGAMGN